MCGIVGYIGKKSAAPILLEGLRRLEYRGYDSAGIAVIGEHGICCVKERGKVEVLDGLLAKNPCPGTIGIAHTRWATHGEPSAANAHPHCDEKQEFFVAHNGIVENFRVLRAELQAVGHRFSSQTDSEILAHLIESLYAGDLEAAVRGALRRVQGTYGLVVISSREPNKIVAARMSSPLLLGIGQDEYLIASDASAVLRHTKQVIYLDDGELLVVTPTGYRFTTLEQQEVAKTAEVLEWDVTQAEKGGHPHFMLKEIVEEPEAVRNAMRGRVAEEDGLAHLGGLDNVIEKARALQRIDIIACGTAAYAGMVGEYMLEEYAQIPTEVDLASEFRYRKPIIEPNSAVLAISQSGETLDTLAALREAKRKGALTLGIVNVVGSSIARETQAGVYNHAGPEIGVASTKAFISQLTVLALFTLFFGRMRDMSLVTGQRIIRELNDLPSKIDAILDSREAIKTLAEKYSRYKDFLFIGRKYNYPIALEGALKLKEISYINAEGYAAGEMKHGPIALIDEDFPTIAIVPKDSVYEKTVSNLEEIKARRGKVIAITTAGNTELEKIVDDVLYIPPTMEMLSPILSVVPLHLFAYYIGVKLGRNVDKPRNLAKSVTVE